MAGNPKRWRRNGTVSDRGDLFRLREAKQALADGETEPAHGGKVRPPRFRTTKANKPRTKSDPQARPGAP